MLKTWRINVLILLLIIAMLGVVWRLVDLSIFNRGFLLQQSQARILRTVIVPAYRGMILDRLGSPLAVSTPVDSVWVNPPLFKATSAQIQELARALNMSASDIKQRGSDNKRLFVYLKREIPPYLSEQIKNYKIKGVFFQREYKRYYPEAESTAHVVGVTNVDDHGQEGLELAYDQWLGGSDGKREVLKDRLGNIVEDVALLQKPVQGNDLALSIDHRLQYIAYEALGDAITKYHADSGSVVVLNAKTGEILAMVNMPSYNPNNRAGSNVSDYRNRAVTDMFEPGSVIKPFTVALALESGKYKPDTEIDTNPGWMRIGGYKIEDDDNNGVVNLTQLLEKSSNIAAAKIMLTLQPQHFWDLLQRMGFGERSTSGFPGEAAGVLIAHSTWPPSVIATMAYGYGISVTPLQLAHAYMILADGGVMYPVTFLKSNGTAPTGARVLPETVSQTVVTMLKAVVENGTGKSAIIPGYQIAGKTGTAYIADKDGYSRKRYSASFVGIAPASDPQFVVEVTVRDPKGSSRMDHFGGTVSAPVFQTVMAAALRLYDVAPDGLQKTG